MLILWLIKAVVIYSALTMCWKCEKNSVLRSLLLDCDSVGGGPLQPHFRWQGNLFHSFIYSLSLLLILTRGPLELFQHCWSKKQRSYWEPPWTSLQSNAGHTHKSLDCGRKPENPGCLDRFLHLNQIVKTPFSPDPTTLNINACF